jgi:hypothetical protein
MNSQKDVSKFTKEVIQSLNKDFKSKETLLVIKKKLLKRKVQEKTPSPLKSKKCLKT